MADTDKHGSDHCACRTATPASRFPAPETILCLERHAAALRQQIAEDSEEIGNLVADLAKYHAQRAAAQAELAALTRDIAVLTG